LQAEPAKRLLPLILSALLLASCVSSSPGLRAGEIQGSDPGVQFSYRVSYPLISDLANEETQHLVNGILERFVRKQIADRHNEARRIYQQEPQYHYATGLQGTHEAEVVRKKLFSTVLTLAYPPGPHPQIYTFNFRLDTGGQVQLRDLLDPDSNYLSIVCNHVFGYVSNKLQFATSSEQGREIVDFSADDESRGAFGEAEGGICAAPDARFYQAFVFTRDGLKFIFSPCAIYYCAAGPIAATVPYSALRGLEITSGPMGWVT
jgi:Protein of unknown function (DUF3298)